MAIALSACAPLPRSIESTVASGLSDSSTPSQLASFYGQAVTWTPCEQDDSYWCAKVSVPLDYAHPDDGDPVSIAVSMHKATKTSKGTLFFNPGGPGGSGYTYSFDSLSYLFSADVIENFDIVGFDPRGVGSSTAVTCFDSDAEKNEYVYGVIPGQIGSAEYVAAANAKFAKFAEGCQRLSGSLLAHVDTVSAARDIDVLRAAVGADKINYVGFSYGTLLGTTYAGLFPERVARFVFDGAEDPTLSITDLSVGQMQGFDGAIRAYVESCLADDSTCPLSGTQDEALDELMALVKARADDPITIADGRVLGVTNLLQVVVDCMYSTQYRPVLNTVLTDVKAGKAESAFALLDVFNSRDADGSFADNSIDAFYAVLCVDYPRRTSADQITEDIARFRAGSSLLGDLYADGTAMCNGWSADPVREPAAVSAEGSGPILIVGTTGDPATPYSWAVALDKQLANSRLLTVTAYQHTSYSASASDCVVSAVDGFLLDGTLPPEGKTCEP